MLGDKAMSVTSVDQKAAAGAADDDSDRGSGGRLWILSAIVAGAAVLAGFYGVDAYSAGTMPPSRHRGRMPKTSKRCSVIS
jgi:hypothetical protein